MTTKNDTFGYTKLRRLTTFCALVVAAVVVPMLVSSYLEDASREWLDKIFVACVALVPVTLAGPFFFREVVITEQGAGRAFYCFRGRMLPWDKVQGILCTLSEKDGRFATSYLLRRKRGGRLSGVAIYAWVDRSDEVVRRLEEQVRARGLSVSAVSGNSVVALVHLPHFVASDGWS